MTSLPASPCCSNLPAIGGVDAADFAGLDRIAVRLVCLDDAFAAPLQEMGEVIGKRVAMEHTVSPLGLEEALAELIPACGLEGVIESRFVHRDTEGALLEITGCAEALGEPIPVVGRAVCGLDAGLFEGFLRGVTGEPALTVDEVTCLGLGHDRCAFRIRRRQSPSERAGEAVNPAEQSAHG